MSVPAQRLCSTPERRLLLLNNNINTTTTNSCSTGTYNNNSKTPSQACSATSPRRWVSHYLHASQCSYYFAAFWEGVKPLSFNLQ
jgi:hypothetical protein